MSANQTAIEAIDDSTTQYSFMSSIPIPNYLLAVVVGNLEYRSLGHRVGLIAEPEQMPAAARELSDLERYLNLTEDYLTPYIWGDYNIIILPPSCPNGAMENPLLTTMSPTVIVGDKSQVHVACHEIAHSWVGNLVTNSNWGNLWLNEGFATFVERHISGELEGRNFMKMQM